MSASARGDLYDPEREAADPAQRDAASLTQLQAKLGRRLRRMRCTNDDDYGEYEWDYDAAHRH